MTSRTGSAQRILGDFEKVRELRWDLPRGKTVGFRLLAETFVAGATRVGGGRWKSQNRKTAPLSPYVEEPLNSKVIKSFVHEQSFVHEVVTCFSNFEIPTFYLYGHSMYVSHIAISWLWYKWIRAQLMLWTLLSSQLWIESYYCCSSAKMTLVWNNQWRLTCH